MWKYFGMNRLGENTSWVRFTKRGKKRREKWKKGAGKGGFLTETEPKLGGKGGASELGAGLLDFGGGDEGKECGRRRLDCLVV
jgi:hypothetical protein